MPLDSNAPVATPISVRAWLHRGVIVIGALALLVIVALLVALAVVVPELPDTATLSNYKPKQPLRVYTADGVEMGGFGTERRVYQRIDQIPKLMKDSLLAVEDTRF